MSSKEKKGIVYLVGAGPGDPGLMTVKGLKCLQSADVVVYDRLADSTLWNALSSQVKLIDAGKMRGSHKLTQEGISQILIKEAKKGKTVVRLKGGDPVVFGRVGEEALALSEVGIRFEIIPGISSVMAAASYAGIPLTHRDFTRNFTVLTGHENPYEENNERLPWEAIAKMGTIVILMGSKYLKENLRILAENGKSLSTPAAAIQWGCCARQKTVVGSIADLAEKVKAAQLSHPMLVIIGDVVTLREKMNWFESRPLFGQRIVVTRARAQSSVLVEKLQALGADVFEFPTIEIVPPQSWKNLDAALKKIKNYSSIAFTSTNAVDYTMQRLKNLKLDSRAFSGLKIASIGGATSDKIREYGLEPDIEPKSSQGKHLAEAIVTAKIKGTILFPQSKIGGDDLIKILSSKKIKVDRVVAYENQIPQNAAENIQKLKEFDPHWITFASSSSVNNFASLLGEELNSYKVCKVAAIGPVTAASAKRAGLQVLAQSPKADIEKMVFSLYKQILVQ